MTCSRCLCIAIAVIVAASNRCPAQADEKLPPAITNASSPLSESQKLAIRNYVEKWLGQLCSSDKQKVPDAAVAQAQVQLRRPLRSNPSEFFLPEYRKAVGDRLEDCFRSERVSVRLNVMITASALKASGTIPLLIAGLSDENVAVRYWAAKASLTTAEAMPPKGGQMLLLNGLKKALERENTEQVLQKLILALAQLTIPEATKQVLDALNTRVEIHLNRTSSLKAEIKGFRDLILRMIQNPATPPELQRQFAKVAARYSILCATLLNEGGVPKGQMADYRKMVALADENLKWLVVKGLQRLGENQLPGQIQQTSIRALVGASDWPAIKRRSDAWKQVLIEHLEVPAEELDLRRDAATKDEAKRPGAANGASM